MSNKILIADDSKLVLSLVKNILEGSGCNYSVITAQDGNEAIHSVSTDLPDLILMDWQMPNLTGIEALLQLKKNPKTADIPVIMLTASESTTEAFDAGAIDFIQKPFNKNELLARVRSVVESVNAKKELKQKLIENEIQRDKLRQQKDLLVKQKKELFNQMGLATKVYQLLFHVDKKLENITNDNFVLSMPISDIPSNMIWAKHLGKNLNICVAFTAESETPSVLISAALLHSLGQIVDDGESQFSEPSKVVQQLNSGLHNLDKESTDILFCSFDTARLAFYYSGANIPIYVLKNGKLVALDISNAEQGDYSNHKVQLSHGDIVYFLRDGFIDGRPGEASDRYLSDELQKVILKIHTKELWHQRDLLVKTFENWKKDLRQLRDIFVLGIKV